MHGLDAEGGAAFRTALAHPEMLEILTAHMHLSVLLGEIYGRDPQGLERALTSLANDVAGSSGNHGVRNDSPRTPPRRRARMLVTWASANEIRKIRLAAAPAAARLGTMNRIAARASALA